MENGLRSNDIYYPRGNDIYIYIYIILPPALYSPLQQKLSVPEKFALQI